jgi:putative membrane protein
MRNQARLLKFCKIKYQIGVRAMKRLGFLVTSSAIALATMPVFAQAPATPEPGQPGRGWGYGYGHMCGNQMWGDGWGWHPGLIVGPIVMVLILIGIIAIIVSLVRWFSHGMHDRHAYDYRDGGGRGRAALDILEERFARGDIDKAEFEEKRKILAR